MAELWTMRMLCAYLHKSAQTVRRLVKAGKLPKPSRRLGSPLWDAEDIKRALK